VFRIGSRGLVTAKLSLLNAATGLVCLGLCLSPFSFAQTPSASSGEYAAKAISVIGQVSVLRDNQEWAVEVGGQVRAKELIFTGPDGQARFEVSDGSTFDVYPNSRVVFRKNVPNWRDLLDVLVGRVKIHIQHWGDQPNHNRVLTPTAVISVRGTTFDVSVDDDDETTLVEVEEGSVEVQHALLPSGNAKTVNAGESLLIYRNVPIATGRFDKGEFFKRAARMAVDAISTWESRAPRGVGGSAGGGGGSGSGDTKKQPPPPPPPAPPSAPGVNGGFIDSGPSITASAPPPAQTRWHRFAHLVLRTVTRLVFGESPEDELGRAVGHHCF
jgi:FecR protein